MLYKVTDMDDYNNKLMSADGKLVVICFYTVWSRPCARLEINLEEMSGNWDDVVFLKVDVEECVGVAEDNDISVMPTIILMKNRTKVTTLYGEATDEIEEVVMNHIDD